MTAEFKRHLVLSIALLFTLSVVGCAANTLRPKDGAPEHHLEVGFRNPNPNYSPPQGSLWRSFWARRTLENLFSPDPIVDLPRVENDGRFLRENGSEATVTWIGHSTLLIQLEGINILTDPQWSQRASPVSFAGPKRFMEPGLRFEDLPRIDLVVISHDHYDHLDVSTVTRLAEVHRPTFFVPLGLKDWFAELEITDVVELDWWESRKFKNLVVTCVPAQHFSGRTPWTRNRTLWAGWVVAGQGKRFYFAGDTGYYEGLKEIGQRLGPFDLTAIAIGPYVPDDFMRPHHTNPEEALQLFLDVKGERFVPIHWGTFYTPQVGDEPIRRVEAEARRLEIAPEQLLILKHGESRPW